MVSDMTEGRIGDASCDGCVSCMVSPRKTAPLSAKQADVGEQHIFNEKPRRERMIRDSTPVVRITQCLLQSIS
jgi:hypothetical protein